MKEAEDFFKLLNHPCMEIYTIMMSGYSQIGNIEKAEELLNMIK